MEALVNEIHDILKDYRADEMFRMFTLTPARIKTWVNQFDEGDREFILQETKNILEKNYCSKEEARLFLKAVIEKLASDLGYKSEKDFLNNTVFLDLQAAGKSQKKMLELLDELLKSDYGTDISKCGSTSRKHFIYLDDVLCTGNTMFYNIKDWCAAEYEPGKTNLQALKDGSANLIFAYIFMHTKNYYKKKSEFGRKVDKYLETGHKMYRLNEIDNSSDANSPYHTLMPYEAGQPKEVLDYKDQIIKDADAHSDAQKYARSAEEFYRPAAKPDKETLFSSAENRTRYTDIMLRKGIEIFTKVDNPDKRMRALGYSLPSQKNFGFGALCFTWRNVANNTPLVFWYAGGGFTPLFIKR